MTELVTAIKALASRSMQSNCVPHEAMQLAQAVLSLAQAANVLSMAGIKEK